jgi:hypothetical protein
MTTKNVLNQTITNKRYTDSARKKAITKELIKMYLHIQTLYKYTVYRIYMCVYVYEYIFSYVLLKRIFHQSVNVYLNTYAPHFISYY